MENPELNQDILKIRRELSGWMILLTWLFLIVFPAILFISSLDKLFTSTEENKRILAQSRLITELNHFKSDVRIEKFLEESFGSIAESITEKDFKETDKLRSKIAQRLGGIKIAGLITHSKDFRTISTSFNPFLKNTLGNLPRAFTRRFFISTNINFSERDFDFSKVKAFASYMDQEKQKTLKNLSDTFFRSTFGLIADIPVLPGRICKSISGKLKGTVFFYYLPVFGNPSFHSTNKEIYGGFLAIIRAADINIKPIIKKALISLDSDVIRDFSVVSPPIKIDGDADPRILTSFSSDSSGINLLSPAPIEVLNFLIQGGGLSPLKLKSVCERLPLLKVSIPKKSLNHRLRPFFPKIKFLVLFFSFVATLFLLHGYFFGLEFKISIRKKVMLGLLVILVLPISLLIASSITYFDLSEQAKNIEISSNLHTELESIQTRLSEFEVGLNHFTISLANRFNREVVLPLSDKSSDYLKDAIKNTVVSDVFVSLSGGEIQQVISDRPGIERVVDKDEDYLLTLIARTIAHSYLEGSEMQSNSPGAGGIIKISMDFINNVLNSYGRLLSFERFNTGNKISLSKFFKLGQFSTGGVLILRYSGTEILKAFVKEEILRLKNKGNIGESEFEILYFLHEKKFGHSFFRSFAEDDISDDLPKHLKASLAGDGTYYCEKVENGLKTSLAIKAFSGYPLIAVIKSSSHFSQNRIFFLFGTFCFFLIFLAFVAYFCFGVIYIHPIDEFIKLTEFAGAGNYEVKAEIYGQDEFSELNQAFIEMIDGVKHKEKLAQFVSDDVVEAIEEDSEIGMEPGGEKVEATIVFLGIALGKGSVDESNLVESLNNLIYWGDTIARSYGGVLDKVIEDTLMLVFRDCNEILAPQAVRGASAIIQIKEQLKALGIKTYAGIASGMVVSGKIGSRLGKLDYTVIGDTVNMAARLKGISSSFNEGLTIVAPSTIRKLKGAGRVRFIARMPIKGKSREYPIYELISMR